MIFPVVLVSIIYISYAAKFNILLMRLVDETRIAVVSNFPVALQIKICTAE